MEKQESGTDIGVKITEKSDTEEKRQKDFKSLRSFPPESTQNPLRLSQSKNSVITS